MPRLRRPRGLAASVLATAIAAGAVVGLAHLTGAKAIGRVFDDVDVGWVALVAAAELLTYPAYMLAYRAIAEIHGHAPLALALGALEWVVLSPIACGAAVLLLATGARVPGSLLWPWALAVPAGFLLAFWAAPPERRLPL